MSDGDELQVHVDHEYEDNAHQACYVFRPFAVNGTDTRPSKKRKVSHPIATSRSNLPRLCLGNEPVAQTERRLEALQSIWSGTQEKIDQLITENDASSLSEIMDFSATSISNNNSGRLKTGLVVSGPDSSLSARLFSKWKEALGSRKTEVLVQLSSNSCSSLQICLKNIIKAAITEAGGTEGYTTFLAKHKRLIPMNFDLELLQLYAEEHGVEKIIVSLVDVETFDTSILSQILWSLGSWSDRIPFVLLLGVATTVELLESRLSKSTVGLLDASILNLRSPDDLLYRVFATFQNDPKTHVFLSPSMLAALHELSQSQGTTITLFVDVMKLTLMSHFFANVLSFLAYEDTCPPELDQVLCQAIRNTDSFRDHCENLLEKGGPSRSTVRSLLNDDSVLIPGAMDAIAEGQKGLRYTLEIISALRDLYKGLDMKYTPPFVFDMELYNHSDDLAGSAIYQEILNRMRRISSHDLLRSLETLHSASIASFGLQPLLDKLRKYQKLHNNHAMRIPDEKATNNLFATHKSPTKDPVPPAQKQYIALMDAIAAHISGKLHSCSFSFDSFMHEVFVINSRQLLLSLTTPRPRQVLERALAKPADYLGCECGSGNTDMHGSQHTQNGDIHVPPSTSILYHLLQEAGTIINVRDLFDAFQSRLDPLRSENVENMDDEMNGGGGDDILEEDSDSVAKQRRALCLFYGSLSELKMLGMVKSSTSAMTKKRALASEGGAGVVGKGKKAYAEIDFIAKTSWAGL